MTLQELMEHFFKMYGRRNRIFLSSFGGRINFLNLALGDLQEAIRKEAPLEFVGVALTAEESLRRLKEAGRMFDWYAKLEKLQKIRDNYLALTGRADLGKVVVIDATQPRARVLRDAVAAIERFVRV